MFKFFILLFFYSTLLFSQPPANFSKAKKLAFEIFQTYPRTLYCNCKFDVQKNIDLSSCNMESANHIKRAHILEFEHMMPAENFGRNFKCWQEKICRDRTGKYYGGRKCCKKIDENFRKIEAELYNLWPAVGVINQLRSNYLYLPIEGNQKVYGCDFKIDKKLKKAEPADSVKGIVARANLFMSEKYNVNLTKKQKEIFMMWDEMYPPKEWEIQWSGEIAEVEGYENFFIKKHLMEGSC